MLNKEKSPTLKYWRHWALVVVVFFDMLCQYLHQPKGINSYLSCSDQQVIIEFKNKQVVNYCCKYWVKIWKVHTVWSFFHAELFYVKKKINSDKLLRSGQTPVSREDLLAFGEEKDIRKYSVPQIVCCLLIHKTVFGRWEGKYVFWDT